MDKEMVRPVDSFYLSFELQMLHFVNLKKWNNNAKSLFHTIVNYGPWLKHMKTK